MPKSRHGRGRRSFQAKKGKIRQSSPAAAVPQPPASQTSAAAVPVRSTPATAPLAPTMQYPYVLAELKRIAILAGIALAILVVLALVVPRVAS